MRKSCARCTGPAGSPRWFDPAFLRAFAYYVGEARWWEQHVNDLSEVLAHLQDD